MIVVLSPAKSLDYESPLTTQDHSKPQFVPEASQLVQTLKDYSPADLSKLMSISDKLAALNATRYAQWSKKFTQNNSRQAVLAFNGDVYDGLDARSMSKDDLQFAQEHLRILSGLYGVLRPLDLMQPYRLEMGTKLSNYAGKDLYAFWKPVVAPALNVEFGQADQPRAERVLVNLASDEYFKSIDKKALDARVVQPVFQDCKGGQYKVVSFYAKKARGLMARYIIDKRIAKVEKLKRFNVTGYAFSPDQSTDSTWVFRREEINS